MSISPIVYYSFVELFFCGLMVSFYVNICRYAPKDKSSFFFRLFILALIAECVPDLLFRLSVAGVLGAGEPFMSAMNILYSVIVMCAGALWYFSSEFYQQSRVVQSLKMRIIMSVPLAVMIVMTVLNPLHHLNFHFENGRYIRGPLTAIFYGVCAGLIVLTGFSALIRSTQKKHYLEKSYFRIIALYAVLLLICEILQFALADFISFRLAGSMLVVYIIQQKYIKNNIYIDVLTGANNRNAADRYMHSHIISTTSELTVAMIDIDRFKSINDTLGHAKGDEAIQMLATAFRQNLTGGVFFARYGGDEFILAAPSADTEELNRIAENTRSTLKEMCLQRNNGFELDFSCGIVQKTDETESITDILAAADAEMYRIKCVKKAQRR